MEGRRLDWMERIFRVGKCDRVCVLLERSAIGWNGLEAKLCREARPLIR